MLHENYLSCKAYENQALHTKEKDFSAFYDETTKQYFFALLDAKGKVLMISEGYPDQKSRETGVQSVIKNRPLAERYSVLNEEGQFFLSLKAGNRREIARSCGFKTEAQAKALLLTLTTEKKEVVKSTIVVKETVAKAPKAKVKVEKEVKAKVEKEVKVVVEVKAPKAAASIAGDSNRPTEATLSIEDFLGHENIWNEHGKTGYAKFQHSNSKFYFVVYNPDGSIYLRSNGFAKSADCDKALTTVEKVIEAAESYRITENEGVFYTILSDAKGTELARSAAYPTYTDAFITTPRGREEVAAGNLY
jgi:uncharacterized protein